MHKRERTMNIIDNEVATNPCFEIAERITQRIEAMGIKQSDIISHLGLAQATVGLWFRGKSKPRTKNLSDLAAMLKTTPAWVISGDTSAAGHVVIPYLNKKMAGKRLLNTIWDKKIPRNEVAKHMGVSITTIGKWCNGKQIPNYAQRITLSEFLNVTPEWLIYGQSVALDVATQERTKFIEESKRIAELSEQEHSTESKSISQVDSKNDEITVESTSNEVIQKQARLVVNELWSKAHQQGYDEGYAKALKDFKAGLEK